MDADPCQYFSGRHVWGRWIRVDVGRETDVGIFEPAFSLRSVGGRLELKEAQELDAMPRDWRTPSKVVADGSGAAAKNIGDMSD